MGHDGQTGGEGFEISIGGRFLAAGVKKHIGAAIERGHLLARDGEAQESIGKQTRGFRFDLVLAFAITGDDQEKIVYARDRLNPFYEALGGDEGADHQGDFSIWREAECGSIDRAGAEAIGIDAVGNEGGGKSPAMALEKLRVGADERIAIKEAVFGVVGLEHPVAVLGDENVLWAMTMAAAAQDPIDEGVGAGDCEIEIFGVIFA